MARFIAALGWFCLTRELFRFEVARCKKHPNETLKCKKYLVPTWSLAFLIVSSSRELSLDSFLSSHLPWYPFSPPSGILLTNVGPALAFLQFLWTLAGAGCAKLRRNYLWAHTLVEIMERQSVPVSLEDGFHGFLTKSTVRLPI